MPKTETPAPEAPATASINTITLEAPINRGEQTIREVVLRKPGAGELRGLKMVDLLQMDVTALQVLVPRISSPTLTTADVAGLDLADLLQFGTAVSLFFMTKAEREALSLPA